MLFPGSPVWDLLFSNDNDSQFNTNADKITDMEHYKEQDIERQRKQWEQMKITSARKKLQAVFEKHNLGSMNPGVKEFKMSASHYQELRDAFDKYMKLFHDSKGVLYNPKGTIVFNGPHGPVRIVSR